MIRVYGSRISYYTGKVEAYLRFRSIGYELLPTVGSERKIRAGAGTVQMPVLQLEDGRWMSDSTPIIAWFDAQQERASHRPGRRPVVEGGAGATDVQGTGGRGGETQAGGGGHAAI